jgi:hypothetical protein
MAVGAFTMKKQPNEEGQVTQRLPYEGARSGDRALTEMQKTLQRFGCQSFGSMMDFERKTLIVQFRHRDLNVHIEASTAGYAAAWLKTHPFSGRRGGRSKAEHEREAERIASFAVYSILRDWLKGQVMAIETGIISFEGAFLGQVMLPSGRTLLQHVREQTPLLGTGEKQ